MEYTSNHIKKSKFIATGLGISQLSRTKTICNVYFDTITKREDQDSFVKFKFWLESNNPAILSLID